MEATLEEVKVKNFITKKDLKVILGGSDEVTDYMVKTMFQAIHKIAMDDLDKKGLIIPKKTIIPAVYVWRYLKTYGIEK